MPQERSQWRSRLGFVLAAAGSAVGLGNLWKFPYITGENGGGVFVLIYLGAIVLVGIPIMVAEVLLGRAAQSSPVGAFRRFSSPRSPWVGLGWLGVASAFVILSYYGVVAGWALHYAWLSVSGGITGLGAKGLEPLFGEVYASLPINVGWQVVFMALTVAVVLGGVQKGIERWARVLMPALLLMLLVLMVNSFTLDGFSAGARFVFAPRADKLTAAGVLEAVGHAFFTLSLGMGAMLTYGSYLKREDDLVSSAVAVSVLDTLVALMACLVLFPITFTFGMEPAGGPGLVFKNVPIALAQLPAGGLLAVVFFALLVFAALTSAISLLEVAAAYFIDERGWSRRKAVLVTGGAITALGIPSALSGGTALFGERFAGAFLGKNWFDSFDYLASNWMLPLGGIGIAVFVAWRVGGEARRAEFLRGTRFGAWYRTWLVVLRYLVPVGITGVFLHALGVV